MNNSFCIDRNTPIVIYGASYIGSVTGRSLIQKGYQVVAFIDNRAEEIGTCVGRPVYTIDVFRTVFDNDVIIFVAVKNVYYHMDIVRTLNQYGYSKVVYKAEKILQGKADRMEYELDRAYEGMVKRGNVPDSLIPVVIAHNEIEWHGAKLLEEDEDAVVVSMPAELIYTGVTDEAWTNISVLQLIPYISMFRWLDGDQTCAIDEYLALCKKGAESENLQITDGWKRYVIKNRKDVYINMKWKYEFFPEYFVQHAPEVESNQRGTFTLKTGKHRTAFLLAMGRTSIPVRIKRREWKNYIENRNIEKVKNALEGRCGSVIAIPHPYFQYNKEFISVINQQQLWKLLKKMYEMKLLVGKTKEIDGILDLTDSHGYFARYFNSIGIDVYMKDAESTLNRALNQLFCTEVTDRETLLNMRSIAIIEDISSEMSDDVKQRVMGIFVIKTNDIQYI